MGHGQAFIFTSKNFSEELGGASSFEISWVWKPEHGEPLGLVPGPANVASAAKLVVFGMGLEKESMERNTRTKASAHWM